MSNFVQMYACCIPVKGYKRSLIYDLQRPQNSNFIPNDMYDIIVDFRNKSIEEIKRLYQYQYNEEIDSYFHFLLENNFAFVLQKNELNNFPPLENIWESPSEITNSIIYVSKKNIKYLNLLLKQLSDLRCDAVQFCFTDNITIEHIHILGKQLELLRILSVEILFNYNDLLNISDMISVIDKYPRIRRVGIGNCPQEFSCTDKRLYCTINQIDWENGCGNISSQYFSIGMEMFFESQHHNTCLNRKICIDMNGNIKNCPFMKQSFGNIKNTTLKEAIVKQGFKDFWFICKDNIEVCKNCEFRYMCTDCRCYIKQPANIYSPPSKCTYNPYITLWKHQKHYVPIEECGYFDKSFRFVPDYEKIDMLNKTIWGDKE